MYTKKYMNNSNGRWETMALTPEEEDAIKQEQKEWVDALARQFVVRAQKIINDFTLVESDGKDGFQVSAVAVATLSSAMMQAYLARVYSEAMQQLDAKVYAKESK